MQTIPIVAGVGAPELMIIAVVLLVPVLVILGVTRLVIRLNRRVRDLETANRLSVSADASVNEQRTKEIS